MGNNPQSFTVVIDKLVHGGQGIGSLEDGKKALVWNALPKEKVLFRVSKKRHDYLEGIATEILVRSSSRVEPKDELYLSTSPWQIIDPLVEDELKHAILTESFNRAKVDPLPEVTSIPTDSFWNYRNKMEYSFFGDDSGLHLALFNRGTKSKAVVAGASIAMQSIDLAATELLDILNSYNVRAGDLKSLILRASQNNEVVAALFTRNKNFPSLKTLPAGLKGLAVVFSNPKSPASVRTKDLYVLGDVSLSDEINGRPVAYDVFSFFQVNVPVFEKATEEISSFLKGTPAVDFYSGVGSIGLAVPDTSLLVESDENNIVWAKFNAAPHRSLKVVHAKSEDALRYISSAKALIVDPPRAGLHARLAEEIKDKKPPKIAYLSCNPSTQARDLALLQQDYEIFSLACYNFFPRTPHIECLAMLVRK